MRDEKDHPSQLDETVVGQSEFDAELALLVDDVQSLEDRLFSIQMTDNDEELIGIDDLLNELRDKRYLLSIFK